MDEQDPKQQVEQGPVEAADSIQAPKDEPVVSDSEPAAEPIPSSVKEAEASIEEPVEVAEEVELPADVPVVSEPEPAAQPVPASATGASEEGPAWYVIHCYSGYENKVRHNLEQRIETMGMKNKIFDVVVPTQEEVEVRDGKRRTVERHIFPGYVLVNMVLTEESWYVVRNTPGVTGFVGMGNLPTPLRPEEVAQIVKRMEAEAPTVKVSFKAGERVRIVDGPFNDFRGIVAEIDMERTKVRVMVNFFGRETPVELDFLQVEKA
jgi:transcriptional antiterminator NusG